MFGKQLLYNTFLYFTSSFVVYSTFHCLNYVLEINLYFFAKSNSKVALKISICSKNYKKNL